jgi:O-antigen ligase
MKLASPERKIGPSAVVDAYLIAAAIGAAAMPALLAYNVPPSATFFNQAAAMIGWGLVAALTALSIRLRPGLMSGSLIRSSIGDVDPHRSGLLCLVGALCIVALCAAQAAAFGPLPSSLALSAIGMIAAALVLFWAGASARRAGIGKEVFRALCIAMVVAGLISVVIGFIQVYIPSLADGVLIAPGGSGRASGNLRQANHLSSLVVWAAVASAWLYEERAERRFRSKMLAAVMHALFVFAVALSASRTGMMELVALTLWGTLDKRLSRYMRLLLVLTPVIYLAWWLGMDAWARIGSHVFVGAERLQQADISSSRYAIWSNAIALIKAQPWLGTGFGEFNMAWTLTPFPGRPTEFFDHPHNLVLHLATELGIPLATIITAMLCWALWRMFAASRRGGLDEQRLTRAGFVMVVTIATHSMLEYPLWYAYFLLPTALMLGLGLGADPASVALPEPNARVPAVGALSDRGAFGRSLALMSAALVMVALSIGSLFDYYRVVVIFDPPANAGPLMDRIADGEHSWLFAHHAGYADATTEQDPPAELSSFAAPIYYLLDARLMMAWADAYARNGDLAKASYIARRLREFNNGDTTAYFAPCDVASLPGTSMARVERRKGRVAATLPSGKPYQCVEPTQALSWRDFR